MSEIMEKYIQMAIRESNIEKIQLMIQKEYSKEDILSLGFTDEEYSEAIAEQKTESNR